MSWRFLFWDSIERHEKEAPSEKNEPTVEDSGLTGTAASEDEIYQKKLFENDLYVWSLLLFKRGKL